MAVLSLVLLAVGVAGALSRPGGLPAYVVPLLAVALDLLGGAASGAAAGHAISVLGAPVAFLLVAVPFAVLLDRLGFFAACASLLSRGGHSLGGLWVLAAVVTTVLNLDAAVVLLTPLYVRLARQRGLDPLGLALQPLLTSWLASSALPVSNLTNLIVASATKASVAGFVTNLGLPSLAASTVGWICYRRLLRRRAGASSPGASSPGAVGPSAAGGALSGEQRRALRLGGPVVLAVLVGFVLGPGFSVAGWEVALAGDVVVVVLGRSWRRLPWRAVPVGTALVAGSLGVLATAAVAHLSLLGLLGGTDLAGLARTAGLAALAANVVNNLPALLVLLPSFHHHAGPRLWAALLGVNMGPVLVVTGTLASLLWVDTLARLDVRVRRSEVSVVGAVVGLPAALSGLGVFLALHAVGVS